MYPMLEKVLIGVSSGIAYGTTGFGKSKGESMEWSKLGVSVIIGGLAGVVAEFLGLELQVAHQFLASAGLVVLVENTIKTIWRRFL